MIRLASWMVFFSGHLTCVLLFLVWRVGVFLYGYLVLRTLHALDSGRSLGSYSALDSHGFTFWWLCCLGAAPTREVQQIHWLIH